MRGRVLAVAASGLLGLAVAGCGAGQDAPTASNLSSVPGVNADDAGIGVRNVRVAFDPEGYPAGSAAPIELSIVNNGTDPVELVDLSSTAAEAVTVVSADQLGGQPPNGGAGPLLMLPPDGMVEAILLASGLAETLDGTVPLPLVLAFDNGAVFMLEVPTAPPMEAQPREPADPEAGETEDH